MSIRCPYCQTETALKGARPGRFAPRCQHCSNTFSLTISADPTVAPIVAKSDAKAEAPPAVPTSSELTGQLGNYLLLEKLGDGTTGPAYLARDPDMERDLSIKVLASDLAANPQFVARFTRDAYNATQLNHPHLLRVLEIGLDRGMNFYCMEPARGKNLAQVIRESGRVEATVAATYVLQAARALKYAHDRGLLHRDIKPENLLLDEQGVVKVAKLGLPKRAEHPDSRASGMSGSRRFQNTLANLPVGTPAYMPPEQALDAAHVDSRADIYSLGCSLYDLLTGRPPFLGRSAYEVITRHQREPMTPPEMIVRDVPKTLSAILMKMTAKKPQERYQSMTDVIRSLEDYLGVSESGPFAPRQDQVRQLESAVQRFNTSGWALLRTQLSLAFLVSCAIGAMVLGAMQRPLWAGWFVGLIVVSTVAYQLTVGVADRTYLFLRARQFIQSSNVLDWIAWSAAALVAAMLLFASGWIFPWIPALVVGVLLAMGMHFTIDAMLARDREKSLIEIETMLRTMRNRGMDESVLRQFVCQNSGSKWEEFYETLFGYEAKMQTRKQWGQGESSRPRRKFGAWRDPLIRLFDRRRTSRQAADQRRVLQTVELNSLLARGVAADVAPKQAAENVKQWIESAGRLKNAAPRRAAALFPDIKLPSYAPTPSAAAAAPAGPAQIIDVIKDVSAELISESDLEEVPEESDEFEREHLSWFQRRFGSPIDLLIGRQVRFVLAIAILLGFAFWWRQNKVDPALQQAADVASRHREISMAAGNPQNLLKDKLEDVIQGSETVFDGAGKRLVELPYIPQPVRRALSGWNAGLAGLLLLLSVFCEGRLMSLTVLLAAAVALVGHWTALPGVGLPLPWMSAAAAGFLGLVALFFFRVPEGI